MTPDDAAESRPMPLVQLEHQPAWAAPAITKLDVTRSLAGSGIFDDFAAASTPIP